MKFIQALMTTMLALGAMAQAQETGEPGRGLAVARVNCSGCHAIARGEKVSPNHLAPTFERVANTAGMTAIAFNHLMHSAHKTMPLIILAPEDQWHLTAYVLSLRNP